jgi:hypothetical protein
MKYLKKNIIQKILLCVFFVSFGFSVLANDTLSPINGVAIYDVFYKEGANEYRDFNSWIRNNPEKVFQEDVDKIYDSVFVEDPTKAASFVQFADLTYGFIIFSYELSTDDSQKYITRLIEKVPLDDTDFRIDIFMEERELVLTDQSPHKLQLIFPIDHGGLSVDNSSVTTPLFKNAYLDKRTIIDKRTDPSYYQGKPFLRVMTSQNVAKGWTGIGIHIKQTPELRRSPDSHGCIRLRDGDLTTVHAIVKYRDRQYTDLSIHMRISDNTIIHPLTFYNKSYKKEKNFGTNGRFETRRDTHGLTVYETITGSPVPLIEKMLD